MNREKIKKDIEIVFSHIEHGDFAIAKDFFNTEIKDAYEKILDGKKDFQVRMFIQELDEYLNDPVVKIVNATTFEELKKGFLEVL